VSASLPGAAAAPATAAAVCLPASVQALKDAISDDRLSTVVANLRYRDVTSWLPSLTAPVTLSIGESVCQSAQFEG